MLSKRGKANGKATAKKAPRAARANQKSKASRTRPKKSSQQSAMGGGRSQTERISAPVRMGLVRKNGVFGFRFGAAAPHDEFPDGGLRIAGVLPGSASSATLTQDTVYTGLFGTAGWPVALVTPTGTTSAAGSPALFSATGPLAVFAQYFRKFKFRMLQAEVDTMITTGGALGANGASTVLGSPVIQLSHEKDVWAADQTNTAYTIDTAVQSSNCTRFNAWANDVICPLIREKRADRADELHYISPAGTALGSSAAPAMREACQGAVIAIANVKNTLGDLALSKVLYRFEIDLYGFTNLAEVIDARTRANTLKQSQDRGDYKRPFDQPDADLADTVVLEPMSNRLRIATTVEPELQLRSAPPSVQGARVSSKK